MLNMSLHGRKQVLDKMSEKKMKKEELTLREIQIGELEVLKQLHKLCEKIGVTYYLFYGTLLGAVRHKGFIPWDDDVDVVMFRDDYNKLVEYCANNANDIKPFELLHYSTRKNYPITIARFSDSRYTVNYSDTIPCGMGLFVDIYPFDGVGRLDERKIEKFSQSMNYLKVLVSIAGKKDFHKSKNGKILTTFVKWIVFNFTHFLGVNYWSKRLDNKAKKYKVEESINVGDVMWYVDGPYSYPKEMFGCGKRIRFEDGEFIAPDQYKEILAMRYGDYMKLPPKEKQKPYHNYSAYLK